MIHAKSRGMIHRSSTGNAWSDEATNLYGRFSDTKHILYSDLGVLLNGNTVGDAISMLLRANTPSIRHTEFLSVWMDFWKRKLAGSLNIADLKSIPFGPISGIVDSPFSEPLLIAMPKGLTLEMAFELCRTTGVVFGQDLTGYDMQSVPIETSYAIWAEIGDDSVLDKSPISLSSATTPQRTVRVITLVEELVMIAWLKNGLGRILPGSYSGGVFCRIDNSDLYCQLVLVGADQVSITTVVDALPPGSIFHTCTLAT